MNYNLLEEKWLPVLWKNGITNQVGIIEALTQADRIREIAASNPMDRMAILRFLLALLYWCRGNPPDKIPETSFPSDWFKKVNGNKDSFNLLGTGKRLYQDHTANHMRAVTHLIQEIPSGNVVPTPVGVNRQRSGRFQCLSSCPHARGGEPKARELLIANYELSPRPWG